MSASYEIQSKDDRWEPGVMINKSFHKQARSFLFMSKMQYRNKTVSSSILYNGHHLILWQIASFFLLEKTYLFLLSASFCFFLSPLESAHSKSGALVIRPSTDSKIHRSSSPLYEIEEC